MNTVKPQQLLDIVREHLQRVNASARDGRSRSLSSIARDIAVDLACLKIAVPLPAEPLPNAESLAAFCEGQASSHEELAILSACVHDAGLLLQLLSIAELQYAQPTLEIA